ncbi:MAG TPA: molybdopterin-dependent oxidoreductase [Candidatus Binatia bacterium]|nr:molybdopterin-dependent oxidoreductase [Candidatus Binatia bacterium]
MVVSAGIRGRLTAALIVLVASMPAISGSVAFAAESLPQPATPPILVVDGNIAATNRGKTAAFDLALLKTLPQTTLKTMTAWTEGESSFTGVRLRDLLDRLGAQGSTLTAAAIDDYRTDIPMADVRDYDVMVVYAMDGKPLPPDNKGPLWILYPFSQNPTLQRDIYFARCVWQLNRLTVR